jgi:hypothetical protein
MIFQDGTLCAEIASVLNLVQEKRPLAVHFGERRTN